MYLGKERLLSIEIEKASGFVPSTLGTQAVWDIARDPSSFDLLYMVHDG